jgi:DNA-binding transcriptional MerR regulator
MYSIGDFSRLVQVPVKTLRFYDEIGLLPASRRSRGDARSYDAQHVERLNRILALKESGLSLGDIRELTASRASDAESLDVLERRCDELRREATRANARVARAEARLALLRARTASRAHDVAVRWTSSWLVGSVRDSLDTHDDCTRLFDELDHAMGDAPREHVRGAIWHTCSSGGIDCEAFEMVSFRVNVRGRARVRELPARRVASLVYRGDDDFLAQYRAMRTWFAANSLEAPRSKIELFLTDGDDATESLTEIQFTLDRERDA